MIEKTLLDYLSAKLRVPCVMEEPKNPPSAYVRIEKTGGGEESHIIIATFALQSYSSTLFKAAELNRNVIKAMSTMRDEEQNIFKVTHVSDYNFTDTDTKRYRYQAVYEIKYFEED